MADTKTPDGKKLSVGKSTLSLKPRTETGVVRQSFSHGRSKQVVVEVKKRRIPGADGKPEAAAPASGAPSPSARPPRRGQACRRQLRLRLQPRRRRRHPASCCAR